MVAKDFKDLVGLKLETARAIFVSFNTLCWQEWPIPSNDDAMGRGKHEMPMYPLSMLISLG